MFDIEDDMYEEQRTLKRFHRINESIRNKTNRKQVQVHFGVLNGITMKYLIDYLKKRNV
jgi:hypothetical protein